MHRLRISLVIPAWNEAEFLPLLLDSVEVAWQRFVLGPDMVEVIVVDNGSTDGTRALAQERGCAVTAVAQRCIAAARNGGAGVAHGEILAFADADFRLHPETFNTIHGLMSTGRYVGGGTGLTMERWSPGIRATWLAVVPLLHALGLEGGVWFCRRDDFETVGGYDIALQAGEDLRLLRALRRHGRRSRPRRRLAAQRTARELGLAEAVAIHSARKFDQHGDWHFLSLLPRLLFWAIVSRPRADAGVEQYFYSGRGPPRDGTPAS